MSKTYRRTSRGHKTDWLPEIRSYDIGEHREGAYYWCLYRDPDPEALAFLEKHPHRRRDVDNWWNISYNRNPGWWTNLVETRPKRMRDKLVARKIIKGELDPDEALFELNYRPHIYWW